jgi:hypothetical protein
LSATGIALVAVVVVVVAVDAVVAEEVLPQQAGRV